LVDINAGHPIRINAARIAVDRPKRRRDRKAVITTARAPMADERMFTNRAPTWAGKKLRRR
jgi:hypothetical protein